MSVKGLLNIRNSNMCLNFQVLQDYLTDLSYLEISEDLSLSTLPL